MSRLSRRKQGLNGLRLKARHGALAAVGCPEKLKEMPMRRRDFIAALGTAAAWPPTARAQMAGARRLGYLSEVAENDPTGRERIAALTGALRDLGWTEGQNLQIDYRRAILPQDVDRYAAELVALNPNVLFGTSRAILKFESYHAALSSL
jgi:hypothetical protein